LPAKNVRPLLVIDTPYLLFRGFYGLPKTITDNQKRPVNALLATANTVLAIVTEWDPRAVVLCMGPDASAYRLELYPAYHADRTDPLPEELDRQFEEVQPFFEPFGWKTAYSEMEADDLLYTYAAAEEKAGGHTLILTGDRDLFQCAGESATVLWVRGGKPGAEVIGPGDVERRYGIPPELVPDFIALRGDPSDGLPGAKGIGEKTAAELLRRYGSLEDVIAGALRERSPRIRAALRDDADLLRDFKDIATLRRVKGVRRPPDKPTNHARAARAVRARGMNRLADRLERTRDEHR
jgi:DNA polymerase-1